MPLTTDEKLLTISRDALKIFEKLDGGIHPGFRLLHAKGILPSGVFTPSAEAFVDFRATQIGSKTLGFGSNVDDSLGESDPE